MTPTPDDAEPLGLDDLTARDLFAALALVGLLAARVEVSAAGPSDPDFLAECAYELAGAMLAERISNDSEVRAPAPPPRAEGGDPC